MSCCSGNICNCSSSRCPVASDVANTLGFVGVQRCCRVPCPVFPTVFVQFCVRINANTLFTYAQGCGVGTDDEPCAVSWSSPVSESSWGRKCRVLSVTRTVPGNTYFRFRFCNGELCGPACDDTTCTTNAVLKFTVNGVDIRGLILAARAAGGQIAGSCIQAWCIGAAAGTSVTPPESCLCAFDSEGTTVDERVSWDSLNELPQGTEIVVGPMNDLA